jgi:hypothetical protein
MKNVKNAFFGKIKQSNKLKRKFYLLNLKFVTQSRTGLQIYEGHGDQLNRPGPMA